MRCMNDSVYGIAGSSAAGRVAASPARLAEEGAQKRESLLNLMTSDHKLKASREGSK